MGSICSNPKVATAIDYRPSRALDPTTIQYSLYPGSPPLTESTLVSILHADVREGDSLLLCLMQLYPALKPRLTAALEKSLSVRQSGSDWQLCREFIRERYGMCAEVWSGAAHAEQRRAEKSKEATEAVGKWLRELTDCQGLSATETTDEAELIVRMVEVLRETVHSREALLQGRLAATESHANGLEFECGKALRRLQAVKLALLVVLYRGNRRIKALYFRIWRYCSETNTGPLPAEILPNSAQEVGSELAHHITQWKAIVQQFSDSLQPFSVSLCNEFADRTAENVKSVLEATRQSAVSMLAERQQSGFSSFVGTPIDETSPFSSFALKENTPRRGNKEGSRKEGNTPSKAARTLAEREAEIERLQGELLTAREEIANLRAQLASSKPPTCPPSPSPKYTLTVSLADADDQETVKLKALKSVLAQFSTRLQAVKRLSFVMWVHRCSSLKSCSESLLEDSMIYSDFEESRLEGEIREMQREAASDNVLLQVRDRTARHEKAFTSLQLLKFFEELVSKKFECDQMDLKNKRCPKSIPVFIMEYLTRMFGLRKLAIKTVNQILPTLENLCREGQQFAVLFAQLAQLFHKVPVSYLLSLFLVKQMIEFDDIAARRDFATPTKDVKHYSFTGGEALLSDMIPLVYTMFESDRVSGQALIRLLKPSAVSCNDYVLFHIGLRLAKVAINPEHLFALLEGNGTSEAAFVAGLRRSLDIWVSREELKSALKSIVGNNAICRMSVSGKVNHRMYQKFTQSGEFLVSKYTYLQGLIEVYQAKELRYFAMIKSATDRCHADCITFDDFSLILRRLDPAITPTRISAIYQSAVGRNFDICITFRTLLQVLMRHPVGVMAKSVFCESHAGLKELLELSGEEDLSRAVTGSPCPDSGKKRRGSRAGESLCTTPIPFLLEKYLA